MTAFSDPAPDTPARGDAGPRVSEEEIARFTKYENQNERPLIVDYCLDLRDARTALADRDATIAALCRQVEELQGERDAIGRRHEKALVLGASNRERAGDAEARIADLERRLADVERGGMGWRPIASAPKDGTRILYITPLKQGFEYGIAYFSDEQGDWFCDASGADVHPTFWRLLPPAPAAAIPAPQEGKPE